MKNKLLFILPLFLITSLTACDLSNIENLFPKDDDDSSLVEDDSQNDENSSSDIALSSDPSSDNSGSEDIELPITVEQAKNKFFDLAKSKGFEISFKASDDEVTLGYKNDILWAKEDTAFKKDGTKIEFYDYDEEAKVYEFTYSLEEDELFSLDEQLVELTGAFYIGYEIVNNPDVGYLSKAKSVTFLNRPATEYTYSYRDLEGLADVTLIFDNETGITLKLSASGMDATGATIDETFEITSFLTGDRVITPTLHKTEINDEDPFDNIVLAYVSNENANIYADSKLSLFGEDGFQLCFYENKSLVVFLGSYQVNATNNAATLSVSYIYKEATKQYTKSELTWILAYANGFYALAVSEDGSVIYKATDETPVKVDLPEYKPSEQPVEDAEYKITAQEWQTLIEECGAINMESNFQVNSFASDNEKAFMVYYFDHGKVRCLSVDDTYSYEYYTDYTGREAYQYFPNDGMWDRRKDYTSISTYSNSVGILPIPFSAVMFSVTAKAYTTAKWVDNYGREYRNILFAFQDGHLKKLNFTDPDGIYHESNFSKYGEISVTIPEFGSSL